MSLIPITRDELKQLKIQADEEKRRAEIAAAIKETYDKIVRHATGSTETKIQFNVVEDARMRQMDVRQQQQYRQMLQQQPPLNPSILITDELIGDVVRGLRELFPDSKIEYKVTVMARAPDGKMYDVSKMDASVAPFIHASQTQTKKVIDVDWS